LAPREAKIKIVRATELLKLGEVFTFGAGLGKRGLEGGRPTG